MTLSEGGKTPADSMHVIAPFSAEHMHRSSPFEFAETSPLEQGLLSVGRVATVIRAVRVVRTTLLKTLVPVK